MKNSSIENQTADWRDTVVRDTNSVSKKGYIAIGLTVGLFLLWSISFPLSSAVLAIGKIVTTGQNKLLQHPTGGVITQIYAQEGAFLEKDHIIATVEPSSARAELAELMARRDLLLAQEARLKQLKQGVEVASNSSFNISTLRLGNSQAEVDLNLNSTLAIFEEQQNQLAAGSRRFNNEIMVVEKQLENLESEYQGVLLQLESQTVRTDILEQQFQKMLPVVEEGHIAKFRLWDLESNLLQAEAQLAELTANRESLKARMDETLANLEVLTATNDAQNSEELSVILADLASVEPSIEAARKAVENTEIRAPVSGTLTNMMVHTLGGVVQSGAIIGEIVPASAPLQVEVRLMPADIGSISVGQETEVIITAFNRRLDDPLVGEITYISADSQLDETTGEQYFIGHVKLGADEAVSKRIKAGMFAEVYIQTESRTFMSYMMRPITDSFRKAFREQ